MAFCYTQLLGLRQNESYMHSQVTSAYDRLSREKLEEGYSPRAIAGRQQLLEDVREQLVRSNGKPLEEYRSQDWRTQLLDVPLNLVPGTLALLVQVVSLFYALVWPTLAQRFLWSVQPTFWFFWLLMILEAG